MSKGSEALRNVSDSLEKSLWIRSPDILVTVKGRGETQKAALAAKLRQFVLVWKAAPRDSHNETHPSTVGLQAQALHFGQQLLSLLADAGDTLPQDVAAAAVKIATQLAELGLSKFYLDGGHSVSKFNQLSNDIVDNIVALQAAISVEPMSSANDGTPAQWDA